MQLIKSKLDWEEYESIQSSRVYPNPAKHINIPSEFPCFVITNMRQSRDGFDLVHTSFNKSHAKQLLKIK